MVSGSDQLWLLCGDAAASMSPEVLRRAADHYDLSALIQGDQFASKTEGLSLKTISMHEMDDEGSDPKDVQGTDLAAIFFTGGTTGTPKGDDLQHAQRTVLWIPCVGLLRDAPVIPGNGACSADHDDCRARNGGTDA